MTVTRHALKKASFVILLLAVVAALVAGPAAAGNGWISGRVCEQETLFGSTFAGDPIAGATVSVNGSSKTATTDGNGRYNLSLPEGAYTVRVKAADFNAKSAEEIRVGADNTTKLDFLLVRQGGNLVGKVTDEAGNPIQLVSLSCRTGSLFGVSDLSDGNGMYALKDLPVGTHNITVTAPGVRPFNVTVVIHNGQTTTQFITVKTPVFISVKDSAGPVRGAIIFLGNVTEITDGNGSAVLETCPGPCRLTVKASGHGTFTDSVTIDKGGNILQVTLARTGSGAASDGALAGLFGLLVLVLLLPIIIVVVVIVAVIMLLRRRRRAAAVLPPPVVFAPVPPGMMGMPQNPPGQFGPGSPGPPGPESPPGPPPAS